jgi:hypothetical protein
MTYAEINTIAMYVFSFILFGSVVGVWFYALVKQVKLFNRKSAADIELAALRKAYAQYL